MVCKILTKKKTEYFSVVLGYINPGWYEEVIILNEDKTKIIKERVYDINLSIKRRIFIIDSDRDNWQKKQIKIKGKLFKKAVEAQGYDWVLDKVQRMDFGEEDLKKAKALDEKVSILEWNILSSEKDVESLKSAAWDFHDSYIESLHYQYGDERATVIFKGCWNCAIELMFGDIETVHLSRRDYYDFIFSSSILFKDGFVYWVDDVVEKVEEITDDMTYFKARVLMWKMIIDRD